MEQLHTLMGTVIASSMARAAAAASADDLAHGLLAALRRIRTVVEAQAGYGAACSIEDDIHDLLVQRALDGFGTTGVAAVGLPLPAAGPGAARACAILEDTAMSCLSLNAFFPGNTALTLGVRIMVERMIGCLGGVPDWAAVVDQLRHQEPEDDDTVGEDRWTTVALH